VTRLAVFDFDGTVTRHDTLLPFLAELRGHRMVVAYLARRGPRIAATLAGFGSRDEEKRLLLRTMLAGMPVADARRAGDLVAARILRRGRVRATVVSAVRAHVARGDEVVVVSASPRFVVCSLMAELGVHDVITTELATSPAGLLTGEVIGANVRGEEKVRRLVLARPGRYERTIAYGDSAGDAALLAWADEAYWVHRARTGISAR